MRNLFAHKQSARNGASVTPSAFTPPSNVYLDAADVTDMANWLGRTNVSVALNANNYAGTPNSANTVTTTGAVVGHFATTNNTTGNATHLGLAAKAGTWTHLCVWSPANTGNYSVFDISGGTVDSNNGNAVGTVTSLGGGWYWIDTNFPSGVNANTFRVKPGSTNAITPASTEDGSGSDTVFLGPFAAT